MHVIILGMENNGHCLLHCFPRVLKAVYDVTGQSKEALVGAHNEFWKYSSSILLSCWMSDTEKDKEVSNTAVQSSIVLMHKVFLLLII